MNVSSRRQPPLTDKDCQAISRTYRKLCDLYYEHSNSQEAVEDLTKLATILPQVVENQQQAQALSLLSRVEILKARVRPKNHPKLCQALEHLIQHLRFPKPDPLEPAFFLQILESRQLFEVGCILSIRFKQVTLHGKGFDQGRAIESVSRNAEISPALAVELLQMLCEASDGNCVVVSKSGVMKWVLVRYIPESLQVMEDINTLYKCLKLLKKVTSVTAIKLKDRQKTLGKVILKFEDYIPAMTQICNKCYDLQHCASVAADFDLSSIDAAFFWSYSAEFCQRDLRQVSVEQLRRALNKSQLSAQDSTKGYAILANYCKHKKKGDSSFLQSTPHHQQSLLNYLKMALAIGDNKGVDIQSIIDWNKLEKMVEASHQSKVAQLFRILKSSHGKEQTSTVGALRGSIFEMSLNTELLDERAKKVPQNNQQYFQLAHILGEKPGSSESEKDTLQMIKQKGLNSLQTAISQRKKFDLNYLIQNFQKQSVPLVAKLLQLIQLYLTLNEDAIDSINVKEIIKLVKWLQDNYEGEEEVDWGSIGQLLSLISGEEEWKQHLNKLPANAFWLLSMPQESPEEQEKLLKALNEAVVNSNSRQKGLLLGFVGKVASNQLRRKIINQQGSLFHQVIQNIKDGKHYKLNMMMLGLFLKGWHEQQEDNQDWKNNNLQFEKAIAPLVQMVLENFKELPQEYAFLEACLPYKIPTDKISAHLELLVPQHGRLAASIYKDQKKQGKRTLNMTQLPSLATLPPGSAIQMLRFIKEHPSLAQSSDINGLLKKLGAGNTYWSYYPHYMDILLLLIDLLRKTPNQIKPLLSQIILKMLEQVEKNKDITPEEKMELLEELRDALGDLKEKGAYIEIEKVRTIVRRIQQEEIREEIIIILQDYKIQQDPASLQQESPIVSMTQSVTQPIEALPPRMASLPISQAIVAKRMQEPVYEQTEYIMMNRESVIIAPANSAFHKEEPVMFEENVPIQKQFESVRGKATNNRLNAFEILNRIVERKEPTSRFAQIYPVFVESSLSEEQKELLGTLLHKYYPMQHDKLAIDLLLDPTKTLLGREAVYDLVSSHVPAFVLVRRWKLHSRQALELAMKRVNEGWVGDGCSVAQYNILTSSQLTYFFNRKLFLIVPPLIKKVDRNLESQIAHYLSLVGTAAKAPQIRDEFVRQGLHMDILPFAKSFPYSLKVIGNLCYALSSLSFQKEQACAEIVNQSAQIEIIFALMLKERTDRTIIEPGACFIANICHSTPEIKEKLRKRKIIELLLALFEANLSRAQSSTFKQLLRAIGNLSSVKLCSQQIVSGHFCSLAVRMTEELEILVRYDQHRGRLTRLLIDLLSNLAANASLKTMHKEKVPLLLVTLLEVSEKEADLLASCIDAIDSLCMDAEVEMYLVTEKRLLFILLDILKMQEDAKVLSKAMRLIANMSLHTSCISHILVSNILSVIANVVLPHLRVGSMHDQEANKIQGYAVKCVFRLHQTKPDLTLILKSGFMDCVIRIVETIKIQDNFLDIMFVHAKHLPTFLNKRAFSCLIKVLSQRTHNKYIVQKCIKGFRDILNFSYDRGDEREVLEGVPEMYHVFLASEYTPDALFLLAYHLLRSYKLRKLLLKEKKVLEFVSKVSVEDEYAELCKAIVLIAHNPPLPLKLDVFEERDYYLPLQRGLRCKLYRADGSYKEARVDIDQEYTIRVYKHPNGQIKRKYVLNIRSLRDFQVNFQVCKELTWPYTVFAMQRSFFDSHEPKPECCCTLIGSAQWGEVQVINVEFQKLDDKVLFQGAIHQLLSLFNH